MIKPSKAHAPVLQIDRQLIHMYLTVVLFMGTSCFIQYFQDIIKMINLIDQNALINQQLTEFPAANINLSIIGTHASGKSTVLNFTFDCSFQVLNRPVNRRRCTKGIWLYNTPNINILDTEGFDSSQRSLQLKAFEKQISLFCVTVSDVILINLLMNEVGRHSGGHLDILDAIFEVGQQLVLPQLKKLIFVIRDFQKGANPSLIQRQLSKQITVLLDKYKNKFLQFSVNFFFMPNYLYEPEQFAEQARKFRTMANFQGKSDFNGYSGRDNLAYIKDLWRKIKKDYEIEFKSIDDALKHRVFQGMNQQSLSLLKQQVLKMSHLKHVKSYVNYIQSLQRLSQDYYLNNRPKQMKDQQVSFYSLNTFQVFEPVVNIQFNQRLLLNIESQFQFQLRTQIETNKNSKKLSYLIFKKRKLIVEHYKNIIGSHKQYPILLSSFNQKLSEIIAKEDRKLTHLLSLFKTTAESQLYRLLNEQMYGLIFNQEQMRQKIINLCADYHYSEWEIGFKQIWQRVGYRCIQKSFAQQIQIKSGECIKDTWFILAVQPAAIIAYHTRLQKNALDFYRDVLLYRNQENTMVQPLSKVKDIVRIKPSKTPSLASTQCLNQQQHIQLSFTFILLILLLLYGQIQLFLTFVGLTKKEQSHWLTIYWYSCLIALLVTSASKLWDQLKKWLRA